MRYDLHTDKICEIWVYNLIIFVRLLKFCNHGLHHDTGHFCHPQGASGLFIGCHTYLTPRSWLLQIFLWTIYLYKLLQKAKHVESFLFCNLKIYYIHFFAVGVGVFVTIAIREEVFWRKQEKHGRIRERKGDGEWCNCVLFLKVS